jgi:hypothetical protein
VIASALLHTNWSVFCNFIDLNRVEERAEDGTELADQLLGPYIEICSTRLKGESK